MIANIKHNTGQCQSDNGNACDSHGYSQPFRWQR